VACGSSPACRSRTLIKPTPSSCSCLCCKLDRHHRYKQYKQTAESCKYKDKLQSKSEDRESLGAVTHQSHKHPLSKPTVRAARVSCRCCLLPTSSPTNGHTTPHGETCTALARFWLRQSVRAVLSIPLGLVGAPVAAQHTAVVKPSRDLQGPVSINKGSLDRNCHTVATQKPSLSKAKQWSTTHTPVQL